MRYALWRLAVGHRGANLGQLLGVTLGLVVAVFVLLAATVLHNAVAAQDRIVVARDGVSHAYEDGAPNVPASANVLLRSSTLVQTAWGSMTVTTVAEQGTPPPILPGVGKLPPAGSVLVSPALANVLMGGGDAAAGLRGWLPGDPSGLLGEASLASLSELVALAVVTPEELRGTGRFEVIDGRGPSRQPGPARPSGFLLFAVLAILVPAASLIAVAVRLAATRRDRRLATLRLVGATPGFVRTLMIAEAGVAALLAYAAAIVAGVGIRATGVTIPSVGGGVFARDLQASPAQLLGLLAVVVLTACAVAAVATLRLRLSPLHVQRRSRPTQLRWWRVGWLLAGFGVLAGAMVMRDRLAVGVVLALEFVSAGLIIAGLVLWTPLLIQKLAGVTGATPAASVAASRLRFDPQVGLRVVVGLALGAFAFGFMQVVGFGSVPPPASPTDADIVVDMRGNEYPRLSDELRQVAGTKSVVAVRSDLVSLTNGEVRPLASSDDCAEMTAMLRVNVMAGQCQPGHVLIASDLAGVAGVGVGDPLDISVMSLGAGSGPVDSPRLRFPIGGLYEAPADLGIDLLVAEASVGGPVDRIYVTTDGRGETHRQVFSTVAASAPGAAAAGVEALRTAMIREDRGKQRAVNAVLAGAIVIGVAAFAYGVLGMVADRRQLLVTLRALGTKPVEMAELLAVEVAVPLLAAVGTSLLVGLAAGWVLIGLVGGPVRVPLVAIGEFLAIIAAAAAVALLVLTAHVSRSTGGPPERAI